MKQSLSSDLGVYLLSGALSVVTFGLALWILSATLPGGLGRRRLAGFVVGFLLFVAVYLIAMWIYREIDARDDPERTPTDGE